MSTARAPYTAIATNSPRNNLATLSNEADLRNSTAGASIAASLRRFVAIVAQRAGVKPTTHWE